MLSDPPVHATFVAFLSSTIHLTPKGMTFSLLVEEHSIDDALPIRHLVANQVPIRVTFDTDPSILDDMVDELRR